MATSSTHLKKTTASSGFHALVSPLEYGAVGRFALTYSSHKDLPVGQIVKISLGQKSSLGVVVGMVSKPSFPVKPISVILDTKPLPYALVCLGEWLASYYNASPKSVWQTLLPAGLETRTAATRRPIEPVYSLTEVDNLKPSPDQRAAIDQIQSSSERSFLLHGVTGSGKTLVYLELAATVLSSGRSVIVMVPEIALTPQLEAHFRRRFGPIVISSHSGLTPAGRRAAWLNALNSTEPKIVIGPRSSLFLPLPNLGLIVIDECHETTYKQEQNPRYITEAAAAKLSFLTGAKLILGSATPSMGQLFLAQNHKLTLVKLDRPVNQLPVTKPSIVDLRDKSNLWTGRLLSRPLFVALEQTLLNKRQSILYINRRGSASSLICSDCGYVSTCPRCAIAVTFHADTARLLCHYCGWKTTPPAICPDCSSGNMRYLGGGTKRVEAEVAKYLPKARLTRLDRDSSDPKNLHQIYTDLRSGNIDILIGTQMVAKGLDLPGVDTVGIVSADTLLHIPDFTASERTFQLITQVAGRTGRGDRPGRVIIQTYSPSHPAITAAAAKDFEGFSALELSQRQDLRYPPYVYLLKLTIAMKTAAAAQKKAIEVAAQLSKIPQLIILGPAPAFHEQFSGQYRQQLVLKSISRSRLLAAAQALPTGWTIDLDPINLL